MVGTSGHFSDVVPSIAEMLEATLTAQERESWGEGHKFEFIDHNVKKKYRDLGGSHVAREVLHNHRVQCLQDLASFSSQVVMVMSETDVVFSSITFVHVGCQVPTLQLMFEHCSNPDHAHHWVRFNETLPGPPHLPIRVSLRLPSANRTGVLHALKRCWARMAKVQVDAGLDKVSILSLILQ